MKRMGLNLFSYNRGGVKNPGAGELAEGHPDHRKATYVATPLGGGKKSGKFRGGHIAGGGVANSAALGAIAVEKKKRKDLNLYLKGGGNPRRKNTIFSVRRNNVRGW